MHWIGYFLYKKKGDITLDNTELLVHHCICAVMMDDLQSKNICENWEKPQKKHSMTLQ